MQDIVRLERSPQLLSTLPMIMTNPSHSAAFQVPVDCRISEHYFTTEPVNCFSLLIVIIPMWSNAYTPRLVYIRYAKDTRTRNRYQKTGTSFLVPVFRTR